MKSYSRLIAGIALLALVTGGGLLASQQATSGDPVASAGGELRTIPGVGAVPYYLQTDPEWASETLGDSGETMGAAGCTVSCIAMGLSALGHPTDPGSIRSALELADGFTDSGLVVWSAIGDITEGEVRIELPKVSHGVIDAELAEGRPVIAKIMLAERVPHWVLIVAKDGQEYLAMDPLNQARELVPLSARSSAIHAVRVFRSR